MRTIALFAVCILLLLSASTLRAGLTAEPIRFPAAYETAARAISNGGEIAGSFEGVFGGR